jgi:hypothetical protein
VLLLGSGERIVLNVIASAIGIVEAGSVAVVDVRVAAGYRPSMAAAVVRGAGGRPGVNGVTSVSP